MTERVRDAVLRAARLTDADAPAREVRELLAGDHVHAALVVRDGKLLSVIHAEDLGPDVPDDAAAASLGCLDGRTVDADAPLAAAWQRMRDTGVRRLAAVDAGGRYVGLLCLKRSSLGFCSDEDVRSRRTG